MRNVLLIKGHRGIRSFLEVMSLAPLVHRGVSVRRTRRCQHLKVTRGSADEPRGFGRTESKKLICTRSTTSTPEDDTCSPLYENEADSSAREDAAREFASLVPRRIAFSREAQSCVIITRDVRKVSARARKVAPVSCGR
jgi:hypothetical protein